MNEHLNSGNRPRLILVYGLPGSGKSYFSRALAELTQIARYNSDEVRLEMGLKGNYSDRAKTMVYERLLELAKARLKQGDSVIIDANFSFPHQRRPFERVASEMQVGYYPVLLEAEENTCLQRLAQSRPFSEANAKVFNSLKQVARYNKDNVLVLASDQQSLEEMLQRATSYLKL